MPLGARELRTGQPGGLPLDAAGDAVGQPHVRPRDLEVVVVLGVDRGQRRRRPRSAPGAPARCWPPPRRRSSPRTRRSSPGRRGGGTVVSAPVARLAFGHRSSLRRGDGGRDGWPPPVTTTVEDQAVAEVGRLCSRHRAVRRPLPRRPPRAGRRRRRRDGHHAPGDAATWCSTTSPASRAATRSSTTRGPDVVARHPPRLLRGGRGRGRDQHLRREPAQPRRVRHRRTGSASSPRRARGSPARWPTRCRDAGPAAVRARLGRARARSCRRWATSPTPALRDAYAECGRGLRRGRRRRDRRRDLPGPAAGQGGHPGRAPGDGRRGPPRPDRRARRPSRPPARCCWAREIGAALTALEPLGVDLIGLNCATGPAEMSEHLRTLAKHARIPLSVMPNAGLPAAGPARRGVPAHARRAGRGARRVRPRVRRCGWSAAAAAPPRRTSARSPRRSATVDAGAAPPAPGAGRQLALRPGAVPPGHLGAHGRRAHQRQRRRRRSARRCSPRTGRTASASPASRPATART